MSSMKITGNSPVKISLGLVLSLGLLLGVSFRFKPDTENTALSVFPSSDTSRVELTLPEPTLGDSIEQFGREFLGVPYVYGGTSKEGFDCSGFVYFVFDNFQIKVPRTSAGFENFGREVSIDSVVKGDILVFKSPTREEIGHVGIVTLPNGMDSDFIHASSSKEMQVMISSLKQPGYRRRFIKAVRVMED